MRRLLLAVCCAATSLSAQESRSMVGLAAWKNTFPIETVTIPFTLDAPAVKAYAAVKEAYADLNLSIDKDDPTGGLIGIQLFKGQTSFAGFRMARLFDCGDAAVGGPNANTYRLSIVFLTLVDRVDDGHTKLRIGVVASAVQPAGTRAEAVRCASSGVLEQKLVDFANAHLK